MSTSVPKATKEAGDRGEAYEGEVTIGAELLAQHPWLEGHLAQKDVAGPSRM
jgi:hypothetical protein